MRFWKKLFKRRETAKDLEIKELKAQLEKAQSDLERVKIFAENILTSYEELVNHLNIEMAQEQVKSSKDLN